MKEYELFNLSCLIENILSAENVKQLGLVDVRCVEEFFNFACQLVISCLKAEKACQVREPVENLDDFLPIINFFFKNKKQ